jgi:hypothetical protein
LAGNVEFGAERHKSIVFSLDNGRKAKRLRHDPSLHQSTWPDNSPSRTSANQGSRNGIAGSAAPAGNTWRLGNLHKCVG